MPPLRPFKILCGLALLLCGIPVRAGLAMFLTPSVQSIVGSNEVFFTGTLTNTSLTDNLFLNNLQLSFTNVATNYLSADTNAFFANVPGILLPGENYCDVVFGIPISPSTPPGQYCGTVTIQGGSNICAATNLSCQNFQVVLSPAALAITASGGNLVLSWLSPPGGFMVQENSDLTTTNWTTMTNTPTLTNGQNQMNLLPGPGCQFYRLEYPRNGCRRSQCALEF
jgi:hypothetical protein